MSYDTNQELRTIKLGGVLGKKFGRLHKLAVETPAEAIRALCAMHDGFRAFLENSSDNGIVYKFTVGSSEIQSSTAIEDMQVRRGIDKDFSINPVMIGSKNAIGQIIIGIVMVVASIFTGGAAGVAYFGATAAGAISGALFSVGMSLAIGGVTQLLAPKIKTNEPKESDKNKPSYAFNGAVNTTAQGQPVPILYGRMVVGSAVLSAGITSKTIAI